MQIVATMAQIIVALGILNVWLLRFGKPSEWRGGEAETMREEFAVYGLPGWFMGLVGFLKVSLAVLLIVGIWMPALIVPASLGMAALMLGAVTMHVMAGDPVKKSLPALSFLILSLLIAYSGG